MTQPHLRRLPQPGDPPDDLAAAIAVLLSLVAVVSLVAGAVAFTDPHTANTTARALLALSLIPTITHHVRVSVIGHRWDEATSRLALIVLVIGILRPDGSTLAYTLVAVFHISLTALAFREIGSR